MAKVRIYEWAKKNKKQSSEIVKMLNASGHKVRNHTSAVDEEVLDSLFAGSSSTSSVQKKQTKENKSGKEKVENNMNNKQTNKQADKGSKPNNNRSTGAKFNANNSGSGKTHNRDQRNNKASGDNRSGSRTDNRGTGTGGYKKDGKRDFNRNDGNKSKSTAGGSKPKTSESTIEETKKPTSKKKATPQKKAKFDRFKIFDKEDTKDIDSGKTKTQLKKEAREERQKAKAQETTVITWTDEMTVASFAQEIDIPVTDVIAKLFELGIMSTVNQPLSQEVAEVLSSEYNIEIQEDTSNADVEFENLLPKYNDEDKVTRPPVIAIVGHVDHGKTTLLDYLRSTHIADKEAGGITQHIGAYQIETDGNYKITFLDTPGHEAFTAMRARGTDITDIAILVVAADDGVMPQTIEAINHIKAADKPVIVAITKIDKAENNSERILGELAEQGIMAEEWGGEVPVVQISAKTGQGIDELLEYIRIIADVNDYKASTVGKAIGTVLEANLDKGRGAVATVLVQEGTLNVKDSLVIGDTWGTIRLLEDEYGEKYNSVGPSMPVEITGIKDVPEAGDKFFVADNIKEAQSIGEKRGDLRRKRDRGNAHALSLEELNQMVEAGNIKELPVIIKADTQGSAEALSSSLEKIEVSGVKVRVVSKGVGAITESDVLLATANGTIIIGFNVRPDAGAKRTIEKEKINVILNNIIYKIIEEIEDSMLGMREKRYTEEVIGHATISEVFKITGVGKVAGAIVTEGKITREAKMRLVRDGVVLYDGDIGQLKRYQDDVKEVISGQDCGISFRDYQDLKKGDELEAYKVEEVLD